MDSVRAVYLFLLTRTWMGGLLGCLALAAVMIRLGVWQLDRLEEKRERNDRIVASRSAPTGTVDDVLPPDPGHDPAETDLWQVVTVVGEYDRNSEILVRGRTIEGEVCFEVLTPLVTTTGRAVLVDRGWLPAGDGNADAQPPVPAPQSGRVEITGWVRPSEGAGDTRLAHGDQMPTVRAVDVPALAELIDLPLYGGFLQLIGETPSPLSAPELLPDPELDEGPHLGYAAQWGCFAFITLGGYLVLARRQAELEAAAAEQHPSDDVVEDCCTCRGHGSSPVPSSTGFAPTVTGRRTPASGCGGGL